MVVNHYDYGRLNTLQNIVMSRLEDLFVALDVSLHKSGKKYCGCCPIHNGNNTSAFNIYLGGNQPGYWKCRTRQCQQIFRPTVIGFTRGVLSAHQGYPRQNKVFSFRDTIDWLCRFIGQRFYELKPDSYVEKKGFVHGIETFVGTTHEEDGISRLVVRANLKIPSPYFMKRGFAADILDKYDVGDCFKVNKYFSNRAVVPVYDSKYRVAIGFTGRSTTDAKPKWLNSAFKHENCLFNIWFCNVKSTIVLVEGPMDAIKLAAVGIPAVALMGCDLTDQKQILLELSGASHVIILTDNDEPGRQAASTIAKKLSRLFKVSIPEYSGSDPGSLTQDQIEQEILPLCQ